MAIKKLSSQEYNILDKIATKTGMDCWFSIKTTKKGEDYVWDLEENKRLSLSSGIKQLASGVVDICDCLTPNEIDVFINLLGEAN